MDVKQLYQALVNIKVEDHDPHKKILKGFP